MNPLAPTSAPAQSTAKTSNAPRNAVLVTTMVTTSFQIFVLAVLASRLIDEFGLSRFEIGLIGSLNTAVGALTAPVTGRITDRLGARESSVLAQLVTAAGFALMAVAGSVWVLVAATIVLGVPQGWGNPATNALIAERVAPGRRGTTTGIKQSGVQVGIFLAGATLPALSNALGWRGAMWVYAGVFTLFALLPFTLPARPDAQTAATVRTADHAAGAYNMRAVWLIALYAFLMGTSGGAISRFLALFAEEEAGMSNAMAGLVVALLGLAGIGTRIVAGRLAEGRIAPLRLLAILASVGVCVAALLTLTLTVGAWILWPIALLFAVGHAAWNAVAMLAIIIGVPKAQAGRASGAVMFGFLSGLTVGAPVAGLAIDATDSYQPLWIGAMLFAAASAAVAHYADRTTAAQT